MVVGPVGFVAVVGLALWLMYAPEQTPDADRSATWEIYIDAGQRAYQQGNYAHTRYEELYAQGRHQEALPFAEKALRLGEREFGPDHPDVTQGLENYAALLRKTGRSAEATRMEARAKAIQARHAEQNPAN